MNRWTRSLALVLLTLAALPANAVAADSDEVVTPARAWYAAIDASATADLSAFYLESVALEARKQDVERVRGVGAWKNGGGASGESSVPSVARSCRERADRGFRGIRATAAATGGEHTS